MKEKKLINVELIESSDAYALLSKINGVKDKIQQGYELMGAIQHVNGAYMQYMAKYEEKPLEMPKDITTVIAGNKVTVKNEKGWELTLEIKAKGSITETLRMAVELLKYGYTHLPVEWLREVK